MVELQIFKNRLLRNYPFVQCETIGFSHCGREINAFTLGGAGENVLYVGGVHGMEFITSKLVMKLLTNMCEKYKTGEKLRGYPIRSYLSNRGLTIVVCLNPDGCAISRTGAAAAGKYMDFVNTASRGDSVIWQANAVGVDINHNFNAEWQSVKKREELYGITKPCPSKFGGEFPESEPETKAITEYCRTHRLRHAIAFHSQGEEIYYTFGSHTPSRSYELAAVMEKLSGYKLSQPTGTAIGGGLKDWLIEELHIPAFTLEVGLGENPLPDDDLEVIYNKLEEMLIVMSII